MTTAPPPSLYNSRENWNPWYGMTAVPLQSSPLVDTAPITASSFILRGRLALSAIQQSSIPRYVMTTVPLQQNPFGSGSISL